MKLRSLALFAFVLTAAFMLDGCVVAAEHLSKAKIEVNPAPEMRGAGENFTSGYKYRFFWRGERSPVYDSKNPRYL